MPTAARLQPALLGDDAARALVASFPKPSDTAARKDIRRLDAYLGRFIELAPFCCISTADLAGHQEVSPRGDPPGSFKVLDEHTLAIADRPGNNRIDNLSNLIANPHIGLIFFVPGVEEVVRVNGTARLSVDRALLDSMAVQGKPPRLAIVVTVQEAFLHCAKAIKRAKLWETETQVPRNTFPSIARMISEQLHLSPEETARREEATARGYREGLWEPVKP